jgi:hypothetical protein
LFFPCLQSAELAKKLRDSRFPDFRRAAAMVIARIFSCAHQPSHLTHVSQVETLQSLNGALVPQDPNATPAP